MQPGTWNGNSYVPADQSLTQEYTIWKILNIEGSRVDIIPAFDKTEDNISSDYTRIYFRDVTGYNNAVAILDDVCSYLYKNEGKGITARSLDYEDIEKLLVTNTTGKGIEKIKAYQTQQVNNLSLTASNSQAVAKDTTNNTVTYKKARSYYPNIYENQEGAGIDIYDASNTTNPYGNGVLQKGETGVVGESDPVYNPPVSVTDRTTAFKQANNNLTAKYTHYGDTMAADDFKDSNAHGVIFGTGTRFWLASRCVQCNPNRANFRLRGVSSSYLNAVDIFDSYAYVVGYGNCVCPIVSLGSNVKITTGNDASEIAGAHQVK